MTEIQTESISLWPISYKMMVIIITAKTGLLEAQLQRLIT